MQFLHVYEMPGLLEEARANWTGARAVFLQNDTWVVHMYVVVEIDGVFYNYMMNVRKEDRESLPELEDYENAVWDGADDESEHYSLRAAVMEIVGIYEFHGDTTEITELVEEAQGL